MNWFVLSVKRSQEKKVADMLEKMNIEVFKSYVFVNIPEKYRGLVFGVPGVKGYLFLDGKPAMVRHEEVHIIKKWIKEEAYDLVMLSKLISRNEIGVQEWLMKNNLGVKWIGKSNVSILLDEMDALVKQKLREVV